MMICRRHTVILLLSLSLASFLRTTGAVTPKVIQTVVEDGRGPLTARPVEVASEECREALDQLLFNSSYSKRRNQVLDAFGKPESGFLVGNLRWLGHYDECQSIADSHYCATFFYVETTAVSPPPVLTWGTCPPVECSEEDVQSFLNLLLDAKGIAIRPINNKSAVSCAYKDHYPYTAGFIGSIFLFSLIFLLMLMGAAYDWYLGYRQRKSNRLLVYTTTNSQEGGGNEAMIDNATPESNGDTAMLVVRPEPPKHALWERFILSFAFTRNLTKILSTKSSDRSIACLNGLRVLSMGWVILGHSFFFLMETGIGANPLTGLSWYGHFGFQAIANAFFSVDSFFFLSGLLLTYITLKKMAKKNGCIPWHWFYLHRYLRLTPAILITTLIWMYIKQYIGEGPLWKSFQNVETCSKYWWTNILYINNFYPTNFGHQCIGWVWYLANDWQFFAISPIILIPLYFIPWLGLSIIGVLMAASFAVTGALVGMHNIGPNGGAIPNRPPATLDFASAIYEKPYCRIPPYLVGMVLGYLMYRQGNRKLRLNPNLVILGWMGAIVIGMSCVYGLYGYYHNGAITLPESIAYEMLSRFAWGVALAWLVFACKEGYGGWVNDILSWNAWLPLSRVTYSAYLLHPIVIYIFLGNQKSAMMVSLWLQPMYFVGYFAISYAAAVVMAIFIEFPFANLEKLLIPVGRI